MIYVYYACITMAILSFVEYVQIVPSLFVCLWFFVPLDNFTLILKRHHFLWRVANFDLWSAIMAIEQWGYFSVPRQLWHGASVYNGHLRGPVTLTPIAERLSVKPVLTRLRFELPNFPPRKLYLVAMNISCCAIFYTYKGFYLQILHLQSD